MSVKCYYHPDREATTRCEKCEKMICVECRKSYHVTHGVNDSRYATQHDLCFPCYYDIEMEKYSFSARSYYIPISILTVVDVILIVIAIVLVQLSGESFFFFPFGIPFFSGLLFILLCLRTYFRDKKRHPEEFAKLKEKKENFFKTLESGNLCPECGSKVELGVSVCPSCGSNIVS
ncbi:MAG: B-box zinc finger protein [Promethearchaeota archaeon]